ncbi:MAG: hypothetical protein ACK5X3_09260 [Pseudomonadota bacterium]|jgi:hypothetical protein
MNAVDLLSRSLPFLHESAQPYEDDGSNEPLELARDIEAFLEDSAVALNAQQVVEATEDAIEAAYWEFDARKRGDGKWKGLPHSERDAFKWAVRALAAVKGVDRG